MFLESQRAGEETILINVWRQARHLVCFAIFVSQPVISDASAIYTSFVFSLVLPIQDIRYGLCFYSDSSRITSKLFQVTKATCSVHVLNC